MMRLFIYGFKFGDNESIDQNCLVSTSKTTLLEHREVVTIDEHQDLEAKLAKAVEALELWQDYSDGFAYDDKGNHKTEKDIYDEVEQTLAQLSEKGGGE